jgi:hypothetical protein
MTKKQLTEYCRHNNICGFSGKIKADIIALILGGHSQKVRSLNKLPAIKSEKMPATLLEIAHNVLDRFQKNANTGNCYEIATYLEDLRQMGLTDEDLDALKLLVDNICLVNNKNKADIKIKTIFSEIRKRPIGQGLYFKGKKVVNMINVSQEDDKGDTADKIFVLDDGTELGESITGGGLQEANKIKKCISNPTCKRYGCTPTDIATFKKIGKDAVEPHKAEMRSRDGDDQEKWTDRIKTKAALKAQSEVALLTANIFNALQEEDRIRRMEDILKLKKNTLTADILRIVNEDCTKSESYFLSQKDLNKEKPRIVAEGVFLKMFLGTVEIGYTQVKYNNGCWHKNKKSGKWDTSSICGSWNATAYTAKIFDLKPTSQ